MADTLTNPAGTPGTVPHHFLRRLARHIVLRSAVRGRLSWHDAAAGWRRPALRWRTWAEDLVPATPPGTATAGSAKP